MLLPFDAHNHIHMGPNPPNFALYRAGSENSEIGLSGLAIMSTHPRDFPAIAGLYNTLPPTAEGLKVVPCFGVHPWFLHDLDPKLWGRNEEHDTSPQWLKEIEERILSIPDAIVGEIGLDGFHYDPMTGDLVSPIERQIEAFELQMELAARLHRPVSIHAVKCFGKLMISLSKLKKSGSMPPRVYFHAFGGKVGLVDQLLALCGRRQGQVYFGFAPVINFRSSKTKEVIQKVGIDRIVLETDHEDAALVPESITSGIEHLAQALGESEHTIVQRTTQNAFDFYGI